jgi:outer membrane receptor protein involved in Fe transport
LDEVVVVGERQSIASSLDKKSYSTSTLLSNANGSILDAMKQLPGVTIDQEGKLLLRGSDKVAVLIDGKQSALTGFGEQRGLDNIPASQIESIEIINNPSAKYDASGMAGIVNIKFKKQRQKGFSGDVGFAYGLGAVSKRRADLPTPLQSFSKNSKYNPTLNLNYKNDKVNIFLQSTYTNSDNLPNNEFSTRTYPDDRVVENQVAENREEYHVNVKLGADWYINSKNTISLFGLYDYVNHRDTSNVWYFQNRDYKNPIRKYGFSEPEITGFANVTLQHSLKFADPGHELNSQYLFKKGWEDETYNLTQGATPDYPAVAGDRTHVDAPEFVHQINTDYTRPLSFGRVEAGAQVRLRNMPITYTMTPAPANSIFLYDFAKESDWSEDLAALYLNFVAERRLFEVEAGLRGEYTSVDYHFEKNPYFKNDKYDYFDLFPNLRFTLKANDNNRVSLFYNRRIDRPNEGILRIFPKYDDPELLKVGNPALRPQYTDAIEAAYRLTWGAGSFYAAAYYKNITDYFTRVYVQAPDHANVTIKGYDNIPRSTNVGLELNIDQRIAKIWKVNMNGNVYRNKIFATTGTMYFPVAQKYTIKEQVDNPWFVKMNNFVTLTKWLQAELSGVYFSKKAIPQGVEYARWGVDFGLRALLHEGKVELSLTGNDIFNNMGIHQRIDQGNGSFIEYQNFYETQLFSVGVKYKF